MSENAKWLRSLTNGDLFDKPHIFTRFAHCADELESNTSKLDAAHEANLQYSFATDKKVAELESRLGACSKALAWILTQTGPAMISRSRFAELGEDLFEVVDDPSKDYLTVRVVERRDTEYTSRQVMNPPAQAEAGNLANTAPRQADPDAPCRGSTGVSSGSEARPVTATEQYRDDLKALWPKGRV